MNEFAKVCITIQMQNDFESDEACITATMIRTYANALQAELRKPGKDLIGKTGPGHCHGPRQCRPLGLRADQCRNRQHPGLRVLFFYHNNQ